MNQPKTTPFQTVLRILLGLFLLIAGIGHLSFARAEFQAQVPDWVPIPKDLTVVLSGFVEIAFALTLLFLKKYRYQIGMVTAVFFILVFPGNISQYTHSRNGLHLDTDQLRFMRLFFQPVLILWALWSTGFFTKKR